MRFFLQVNADGEEWRTDISPDAADTAAIARHVMRRLTDISGTAGPGLAYPIPPETEAAGLSGSSGFLELCRSGDVDTLHECYLKIASREASCDLIEAFGSYLFATLLGDTAWQAITERAQDQAVELVLSLPDDEPMLSRLPWEMMRNGRGFLAAQSKPTVSMTRAVKPREPIAPGISILPKVLFVVGAELHDAQLRAGAEYMSLLRHLKNRSVGDAPEYGLVTEVLLRATGERVREAIDRFRPSVLHFICHGDIKDDHASIQMLSDDGVGPKDWSAEQLLSLLRAPGSDGEWLTRNGAPPVIVMNACHTGSTPNWRRPTVSLAGELVKNGIPVVVGMWGRVADVACRAFTRSFYDALLRGESFAAAAAAGRRRAFEEGPSPAKVDWAFPTIFMAEGSGPTMALDAQAAQQLNELQEIVTALHKTNAPTVFCGRLDVIDCYRRLMRGSDDPRILAVKAEEPLDPKIQYGKTRVLEELAAKLVIDGHVPCLVGQWDKDKLPSTRMELGRQIIDSIEQARQYFRLDTAVEYEWFRLRDTVRSGSSATPLSPPVRRELDMLDSIPAAMEQLPEHVLGAAIRQDLATLADEAQQKFAGDRRPRVVLLVDDVHRFGLPALEFLRYLLLRPEGLRTKEYMLPVIFAFRSGITRPEDEANASLLKSLEENAFTLVVPLRAFQHPKEEPYPYEQLLKANLPPLVVRHEVASPERVEEILNLIYEGSFGVPSLFNDVVVKAYIRAIATNRDVVATADDDDLISHQASS